MIACDFIPVQKSVTKAEAHIWISAVILRAGKLEDLLHSLLEGCENFQHLLFIYFRKRLDQRELLHNGAQEKYGDAGLLNFALGMLIKSYLMSIIIIFFSLN